MKVRTILTATMILASATACGERGEHGENAQSEKAEAAEAAEVTPTAQTGQIDAPAALVARAKITQDAAKAAALAKVPGGRISSGELEEEDGKLIWSFDVKVDGQDGIEEVHVDAVTGEVGAPEHEGSTEEAAEKRDEGGDR